MNCNEEISDAFEKLCNHEKEIVGYVAYCLYKKDKKEQSKNGRSVSDYHKNLATNVISGYQRTAEEIVERYTTAHLLAAERTFNANIKNPLIEEIKKNSLGFWASVAAGVVATFVFGIIILLFVELSNIGQSPLGIIFDLFKKK